MREHFESQLPPDQDGVQVVFLEKTDDGSLVPRTSIHPWYPELAGATLVGREVHENQDVPVFVIP